MQWCWISIELFVDLLPQVLPSHTRAHAIGKRLSITEPTQSVVLCLIVFYANTLHSPSLSVDTSVCVNTPENILLAAERRVHEQKVLSFRRHMRIGKSLNRSATRDWQKFSGIYRFASSLDNKLIKRSLSIFRCSGCACTKSCSTIRRFRLTPRSGLAPS